MAAESDRIEPMDSEQDEEDVYEVERIIDMRVEEVPLKLAQCYVATPLAWQTWLAVTSLRSHDAWPTYNAIQIFSAILTAWLYIFSMQVSALHCAFCSSYPCNYCCGTLSISSLHLLYNFYVSARPSPAGAKDGGCFFCCCCCRWFSLYGLTLHSRHNVHQIHCTIDSFVYINNSVPKNSQCGFTNVTIMIDAFGLEMAWSYLWRYLMLDNFSVWLSDCWIFHKLNRPL